MSVWGILGYGTGELTLNVDDTGRWRTDTTQTMGAAGTRATLLAPAEPGGIEIAARADAVLQRMTSERAENADGEILAATSARTHRVRLLLEGSAEIRTADSAAITPSAEVGLRRDGGDAETGAGVELGGRLRYASASGRLSAEARARTLLAPDDDTYEEWGASGSIELAPRADGRGLSVNLGTTIGADGNAEGLWNQPDARGFALREETPGPSHEAALHAEIGYGVELPGTAALATPYGRWDRSGESTTRTLGQRLRVGRAQWALSTEITDTGQDYLATYTYQLARAGTLGVEAARRGADTDADNTIMVRAHLEW